MLFERVNFVLSSLYYCLTKGKSPELSVSSEVRGKEVFFVVPRCARRVYALSRSDPRHLLKPVDSLNRKEI
jgi:hypothetical protein